MKILVPRPVGRIESRGQILPLTVLMLVVLLGITGLAIDVSSAFSTQRFERAVADSASLAGAQDLQKAGTRTSPGAAERANARSHAMGILAQQLKATLPAPSTACTTEDASGACTTGSACVLAAGCALPGTAYWVSIRTPSPSCIDCADHPELAVQVTVRNPSFGLTFSRLLGQSQWNVGATSVAAIDHARAYGLITLRPPLPRNNCTNGSNCDQNDNTINVTSNVSGVCPGGNINIFEGDIGTNSNMTVTNNARVCLDPNTDHRVYYYDPYQKWTSPPPGFGIQTLIQDPLASWSYPSRPVAPAVPYASRLDAEDITNCTIAQGGAASEQAKVPPTYKVGVVSVNDPTFTTLTCLKPGVYSYSETLAGGSGNKNAYLLEPGVYWFDYGLGVTGTLIGGYQAGQPGVAVVFKESRNDCPTSQCSFDGNNAVLIAMNYGTLYQNSAGAIALPATDPSGANVETPGNPHILITLLVDRDSSGHCFVQDPEPALCAAAENGNYNHTLNLPGGGTLFLAGVQYAPNDNITVSGNTANAGDVGELISWTMTYTGNSTLNFHANLAERSGVLRLDRACSPSETVCNP